MPVVPWLTMTEWSTRGWPRKGRPSGGVGSAPAVRSPLHHLRADRRDPADGDQALRDPPALRSRQADRRSPLGHQEPPRDRGAARDPGPPGRGRAAAKRVPSSPRSRWDWRCSSACGWSTRWRTSGSPASTRDSRGWTTSGGRSGSWTKTTAPKQPGGLGRWPSCCPIRRSGCWPSMRIRTTPTCRAVGRWPPGRRPGVRCGSSCAPTEARARRDPLVRPGGPRRAAGRGGRRAAAERLGVAGQESLNYRRWRAGGRRRT